MKTLKYIFAIAAIAVLTISTAAAQTYTAEGQSNNNITVRDTAVTDLRNANPIQTQAPRTLKTTKRNLGFGSYREDLNDEGYGVLTRHAWLSIIPSGGVNMCKTRGTNPYGSLEFRTSIEHFSFGLEVGYGTGTVECTKENWDKDFGKHNMLSAGLNVYWDFLKYKKVASTNHDSYRNGRSGVSPKLNRDALPFQLSAFFGIGYKGYNFMEPDVYFVNSNTFEAKVGLQAKAKLFQFNYGSTEKGICNMPVYLNVKGGFSFTSPGQSSAYNQACTSFVQAGLAFQF